MRSVLGSGDKTFPILVLNAGSTSIKGALVTDQVIWENTLDGTHDLKALLNHLSDNSPKLIVHRVVHGGDLYTQPTLLTQEALQKLSQLTELAPLHNPYCLEGIESAMQLFPNLSHYAIFDTAFHQTIPPHLATYPLPKALRQHHLHKYGFHGINYSYCAKEVAALTSNPGKIICCHLGGGCSLCAIKDGKSVDTTMGFTPLDGLMMATRSGSVDPGLLIYLQEHKLVDLQQLDHLLNQESGLFGMCGTGDLREVYQLAEQQNNDAKLALDMFWHKIASGIAQMSVAVGGIDTLIFTGGIGENDPITRTQVIKRLPFFNILIDEAINHSQILKPCKLTTEKSAVTTWVIPAGEALEMASQAYMSYRSCSPERGT